MMHTNASLVLAQWLTTHLLCSLLCSWGNGPVSSPKIWGVPFPRMEDGRPSQSRTNKAAMLLLAQMISGDLKLHKTIDRYAKSNSRRVGVRCIGRAKLVGDDQQLETEVTQYK